MEISFIIVNWNSRELILKCITSILENCNIPDMEIIVVDNNSDDGSVAAIREFPSIKLIQNDKNLGFSAAYNIGIKASAGRFICLLNSDVEVLKGCVEELHKFMLENPKVGMIGPYITSPKWDVHRTCKRIPRLSTFFWQSIALDKLFPMIQRFTEEDLPSRNGTEVRLVEALIGCFWFIRMEAVNQVGLLDERFFIYSEDMDWCKRFSEYGWQICHNSNARAIHIGRASSSKEPNRFNIEKIKSDLLFWEKYKGLKGRELRRLIYIFYYLIRLPLYLVLNFKRSNEKKIFELKTTISLEAIKWLISDMFKKTSKAWEVEFHANK